MKVDGYAMVDDEIILDIYPFWAEFLEFAIDNEPLEDSKSHLVFEHVKMHIMRLLEELWSKLQFPPANIHSNWDSDEKRQFASFRNDMRDLLQSAHSYLGLDLLRAFVQITLEALETQDWSRLEAGLFSLNGIALALDESEEEDVVMAQLFNSPLYARLDNMVWRLLRT
jgi:hypothetical protein